MDKFKRVILIVLDGCGVGNAPDAKLFGDEGANTLKHVIEFSRINLINLRTLGLYKLIQKNTNDILSNCIYGMLEELSSAKDTITGHWELMGIIRNKPFNTYPEGLPVELLNRFIKINNLDGYLGGHPASGTEIIKTLGETHLKTGWPICYTSADSVLQIACHTSIFPLNRLYGLCEKIFDVAVYEYGLARVIARPFTGSPGYFTRTPDRKDFSIKPPENNVLATLTKNNIKTIGIGKIGDIFAHQYLDIELHSKGNSACINDLLNVLQNANINSLIFVNLVDFDMLYGHRNDVAGFAQALAEFDSRLAHIIEKLPNNDLLMITADHGCDPTYPGTDHTRENVPLLIYSKQFESTHSFSTKKGFLFVGDTILKYFGLRPINGAIIEEVFHENG
jgi:phosphopentomutase